MKTYVLAFIYVMFFLGGVLRPSWSSESFGCIDWSSSYLRSSPTQNSSVLRIFKKFTPVKILEKKDKWLKVKVFKDEGWVYSKAIDFKTECMMVLKPDNSACPSKPNHSSESLNYRETFRVIKKVVGCNFVEDSYGNRLWLASYGIWPRSSGVRIEFGNTE